MFLELYAERAGSSADKILQEVSALSPDEDPLS
jgi:hypothetical protein